MARFVSLYRNPIITIQTEEQEYVGPSGQLVPRKRLLEAHFSHDLMDEEAIRTAKLDRSEGGLANLTPKEDGSMPESPFRGMMQDESGRFLPPEIRFSVFDSEVAKLQNGWLDEEEALVVKALRESPRHGTEYREVVPAPAAKPWNGYDDVTDPEKVVEIAGMIEADLHSVLAYEKANQNRSDFVSYLTNHIANLDEADVVVTA